jgi:hypothetical protein
MRLGTLSLVALLCSCSLLLDAPEPLLVAQTDAGALDPCAEHRCTEDPLKSTCTAVDGFAACVCDEGLVGVGGTCAPQRADCAADDCMAAAGGIVRGEATEDGLAPSEEDRVDWFVLEEPSAGGIEEVVATAQDGGLPPVLEFFTAPEDELALARSENGTLRAEVPSGTILFVRATFANPNYSAYSLLAGFVGTDDYPDRSQDAQTVSVGSHAFALETRDDVDVIAVEHGEAGALFIGVELPFAERNDEVRLRLRGDVETGEFAYFGRAVRSVQPGRTVVRIDHPQGALIGGTLNIGFWQDDDHGDELALASPLALSRVAVGALEREGDEDWFVFPGEHRRVYEVVINGVEGVRAALFDGVDEAPYWSRLGATAYTSHPRRSGPAYLRVDGAVEEYTVLVLDTGIVDDIGNNPADVTALGAELQAGAINYAHDEDWFGLTVLFAGNFQFRFAEDRPDLALTLRSADEQVLALGAEDGSGMDAVALELGQEYYLVVAQSNPAAEAPPAYQVQACASSCEQ